MKDIISLLPDSVANQIAAGEVIQRPASVIKELVENSVDAGATDIRIYIKDAGRTLIQVIDNGRGMSETDARMAFERHATSKIRSADDLFTLHTMGFRGEALPSICAISQLELKTRTEDNPVGTRLLINGSKVETQEPTMCEKGSNMMVKNLFYNVPARRKFLKSDAVELSAILREFERLALVNHSIRMMIDTGTRVIDLRPGSFLQRIGDIWKGNLNMQLMPVEIDTSIIKITGFVSRPEFARRRNPLQYMIVNGRNMRHPYFHKAILSCYDSLIAAETQPCYFLRFEVDPSKIDVNIHPTKNEIKFAEEQQIWPLLVAGVKSTIGRNGASPEIDFESDVLPVNPLRHGETPDMPEMELTPGYNPFAGSMPPANPYSDAGPFSTSPHEDPYGNMGGYGDAGGAYGGSGGAYGGSGGAYGATGGGYGEANGGYRAPSRTMRQQDAPQARGWENLYSSFMNAKQRELSGEDVNPSIGEETSQQAAPIPGMDEAERCTALCLQYGLKYIITTTREGVIIIDQHRAHVRVLYEQYLTGIASAQQVSQTQMFPESIMLTAPQQAALQQTGEELQRLGFRLEPDGGDNWRITAIPAMLKSADAKETIIRILESVCDESQSYGREGGTLDTMAERMALIMARSSAISRGRRLSNSEMEALVSELFALPDPLYTPYGALIYTLFDEPRIAKLLK